MEPNPTVGDQGPVASVVNLMKREVRDLRRGSDKEMTMAVSPVLAASGVGLSGTAVVDARGDGVEEGGAVHSQLVQRGRDPAHRALAGLHPQPVDQREEARCHRRARRGLWREEMNDKCLNEANKCQN
jgi:hypothetical protein